jgi:glycine oxidase
MGHLMAYWCCRQGFRVSVREASKENPEPLTERAAAFTSAGMLSPIAEMESGGLPVYEMGIRSMALWPVIHADCGHAFDLQTRGSLLVTHPSDRGSADRVLRLFDRADVPTPQPLSSRELTVAEPTLRSTLSAWMLPGEGHLYPVQALRALRKSSDADWAFNYRVDGLRPGEIFSENGVEKFDWVIDCRGLGARTGEDALPLRGVRGEIFTLKPLNEYGGLNRPIRLLHPRWRVYIVPRPTGEVVVGATEIESEDRSAPSVQSHLELLSAAFSIMPSLAEARVVSSDVNLRPALPNNLPTVLSEPGLTRINGLFRHGWLLAPALMEQAGRVITCRN